MGWIHRGFSSDASPPFSKTRRRLRNGAATLAAYPFFFLSSHRTRVLLKDEPFARTFAFDAWREQNARSYYAEHIDTPN